jgi:hypothetical protein
MEQVKVAYDFQDDEISCPRCQSTSYIKDGKRKNGQQGYRCKECDKRFVENNGLTSTHSRVELPEQISPQEMKMLDVWDLRVLGKKVTANGSYSINFIDVYPAWFKQAVKDFIWFQVPTKSTDVIIHYLGYIKHINYLANYIATLEKKPVVFFSAEMSRKQLTKRFLAMHAGIDSQRLMNNIIYKDEYDSLAQGLSDLAELPIEINDTPAEQLTPAKIRSELRRIQSKRGELGLIVLDYIQKLGDRAAGNRAQAIGKYSGACKDIAKQFNVPFVVLAQINRGVESQSNKRPNMASVKDSGDLEQDSDLLLMLYRDEYYKSDTEDNGVMEVIVGKNRNGATGTCKILFDPSIGAFCDYTS